MAYYSSYYSWAAKLWKSVPTNDSREYESVKLKLTSLNSGPQGTFDSCRRASSPI